MMIFFCSYHDVLARVGAFGDVPVALVITIVALALYSTAVAAVEGRRCAATRTDLTPDLSAPFIDRHRRQEHP